VVDKGSPEEVEGLNNEVRVAGKAQEAAKEVTETTISVAINHLGEIGRLDNAVDLTEVGLLEAGPTKGDREVDPNGCIEQT